VVRGGWVKGNKIREGGRISRMAREEGKKLKE
jgi:hypothetical protein